MGFRISCVISCLYQETRFGKTKLQVVCNLLYGCLTLGHCSKTKWKPRKFYPVMPQNLTYEILKYFFKLDLVFNNAADKNNSSFS